VPLLDDAAEEASSSESGVTKMSDFGLVLSVWVANRGEMAGLEVEERSVSS
jgi:hypothetical protein